MAKIIDETKQIENKNQIIELLQSCANTREGMNDLIEWLKSSDFFTAPSSVEYHNNCIGGLADHSLNVYKAAQRIYSDLVPLKVNYDKDNDGITEESLIITTLLHDVCKINLYEPVDKFYKDDNDNNWHKYSAWKIKDKFPMGHGEKSVFIIQNFIKLTGIEALAIRWHMGEFDSGAVMSPYQKYPYIQATNDYPLVMILHLADTFASYCMEEIHDLKIENKVF